jgi:uncharacterized protein
MTKKIISIVMLLCLTMCLMVAPVYAATPDYSNGNVDIYIHDNANTLSDSDEEQIAQTIKDLSDDLDFHLNALVLTYKDSNGKSAMVYSDDYMDDLFPSSENNIAFVIDYDNDELYLNTMGECITRINDYEVEDCIDAAWSYFEDYEDGKALNALAKAAMKRLAEPGYAYTDTDVDDENGSVFGNLFHPYSLLGSLAASIVAVLIINGTHNKQNKPIKAAEYMKNNGFKVINKNENLVRTYQTKTRIQSSSSGSRSGGGSSHRSSSGRSHGGGGRRR